MNRNEFHDFWKPGYGIEGHVGTAFYYGEVRMGIQVLPYEGSFERQPDFLSVFLNMEWGKELKIVNPLSAFIGGKVGLFQIHFEEPDEGEIEGLLVERELAAGIQTELRYSLSQKWNLNLNGNYITVFTRKRLKLFFISLGVSYEIKTPIWLKEFLN